MPLTLTYTDRHLAIADALRDYFADLVEPPATLSRAYDPELIYGDTVGKTVWVFPTTEADAQRLTRWRVLTDYSFSVVTAERYTPPAQADPGEIVPPAWTDDRCLWVRNNIYGPLDDLVKAAERIVPTAWPQSCRLASKYDPERLKGKLFFSVVEATFREDRRG